MTTGYTRTQIALHWLVAILIAVQFLMADGIGEAWDALKEGEAAEGGGGGVWLHILVGFAILGLVIWRLALRSSQGVPPPPTGESAAQVMVAKVTHGLLYLVMILMPLSGGAAWFAGIGPAMAVHQLGKLALLVLVGLHVLGAVYNHFMLRNGLLARMTRPRG